MLCCASESSTAGFAGRNFMSQKNRSRRFLAPGAISCLFRSSKDSILRITLRIGEQKLWTTVPPDSLDDPCCATQACQTQQTCAQQSHRARLRHRCRPALRKSRRGSAVCSRHRTEVDRKGSKLACGQAGGCEREHNHVRTHNTTRLTLDVGVVKVKLPKGADILIGFKVGKSACEHPGFDANGTCVA